MSLENPSMFGEHPERMKLEGVKVHYKELAKIGDRVEAIAEVAGRIIKGSRLVISDILIEPNGEGRGFSKRLVFENIDGDFNAKKFKKLS